MKLLLNTHAFLWWDSNPAKLSAPALRVCQDPTNALVLNVASVWEMQIKLQLGKLRLALSLETLLESQQQMNRLMILPIELAHVLALKDLPTHHKDPFDRLLVAQANVESAVLVSSDPIFENYPVNWLW